MRPHVFIHYFYTHFSRNETFVCVLDFVCGMGKRLIEVDSRRRWADWAWSWCWQSKRRKRLVQDGRVCYSWTTDRRRASLRRDSRKGPGQPGPSPKQWPWAEAKATSALSTPAKLCRGGTTSSAFSWTLDLLHCLASGKGLGDSTNVEMASFDPWWIQLGLTLLSAACSSHGVVRLDGAGSLLDRNSSKQSHRIKAWLYQINFTWNQPKVYLCWAEIQSSHHSFFKRLEEQFR
jgi:hypothetical protein